MAHWRYTSTLLGQLNTVNIDSYSIIKSFYYGQTVIVFIPATFKVMLEINITENDSDINDFLFLITFLL